MSSVHPFDHPVHTGAVIFGGGRSKAEGNNRSSTVVSQVALRALSERQIAAPALVMMGLLPIAETTNDEFEGFEYNHLDQKPTVTMYGEEIPGEVVRTSPKPVVIMSLLDLREPVKGIAMRANRADFEKPRFTTILNK